MIQMWLNLWLLEKNNELQAKLKYICVDHKDSCRLLPCLALILSDFCDFQAFTLVIRFIFHENWSSFPWICHFWSFFSCIQLFLLIFSPFTFSFSLFFSPNEIFDFTVISDQSPSPISSVFKALDKKVFLHCCWKLKADLIASVSCNSCSWSNRQLGSVIFCFFYVLKRFSENRLKVAKINNSVHTWLHILYSYQDMSETLYAQIDDKTKLSKWNLDQHKFSES